MSSPGIISRLYRSLAPRTRGGTLAATRPARTTSPPTGRDCRAWSHAIDREIEEVGRALLRALGCAEHYVGSQGRDAVRLQFIQDAPANKVTLFLAESVDSRPVTGAEDNVPEPVRVVEVVPAGNGRHRQVLHAAAREQIREGGLCGDLIPGVESLEQRGLDVAYGFPESGVGGLEEARAPGGDRQYAAGPHQSPHLRDEPRHVRREEHPEHADHRVKAAVRQRGSGRIAVTELDIGQTLAGGPWRGLSPAAAP